MRQKDGTGSNEFIYYISVVGLIYLKLIRPCFDKSNGVAEEALEPLYKDSEFDKSTNNTAALLKSNSDNNNDLNWPQNPLWHLFGSDYTVGVLIFSLSSTAGLMISAIMAFDNSTDPEYIYGVVCSLVFTLGTFVLLYASHPLRMSEHKGTGSRDFHLAVRKLCGGTTDQAVIGDIDE
jgi:hypothetical protein